MHGGSLARVGAAALLTLVATRPATAQDTSAPATAPGQYALTPADYRFLSGMIGHHAQALVMAGWAPTHGAGKSIRTLCERIINAQQDEIDLMQRFLRAHGQPVPDAHWRPMTSMNMPGMAMHDSLMPGMLSDAQMAQLDKARGTEFDRLFLTFMIQHHTGAVTMVQQLFDSPGAAQDVTVFKLASDVGVDQTTEINRMRLMLNSLTRK